MVRVLRRMAAWAGLLSVLLFLAMCKAEEDDGGFPSAPGGSTPPPAPAPGLTSRTYVETTDEFMNPERGFFTGIDILNGRNFAFVRQNGFSMAIAHPVLWTYRDRAFDPAFLANLEAGLQAVRAARIKIVLRFRYNEGPWPDSEPDAPLNIVLTHIAQLKPYFQAYADVIAVLQAGFIGAWGEWHTSTNNLTTPENRRTILLAELDALPVSRMVQLRTPRYYRDVFGDPPTEAEAWSGSNKARVGFYNDCFLDGDTDSGTYTGSPYTTAQWKAYTEAWTLYTSTSGET